MLRCNYQKYILRFVIPGGTSRGVLTEKETWILSLYDEANPARKAFGECGMFRGLSYDDRPGFEAKLAKVCANLPAAGELILKELEDWPSIYFAVEMLLKDWQEGASRILFPGDFTEGRRGIDINGLIWMGTKDQMLQQVKQKIREGFRCLKLKIGAIDFEEELTILSFIRSQFHERDLELRVDANGAFSPGDALEKISHLSAFNIHSIEQPIRAGQWEQMAAIVEKSEIPVALDEELIGIRGYDRKKRLLEQILPPYIILKPTLIGGFAGSDEWISLIGKHGGSWWITSALESNIGLNAIAQYCDEKNTSLPQGLGTGKVYSNNIASPLVVANGKIWHQKEQAWNFSMLEI